VFATIIVQVRISRHRGGSRGHDDVLRDGMVRRRMTPTTSAKDPVISIRGLSASYGKRRVLHGVDLEMHRGEILVLLDGSGSGKTILPKQVLGLAKPDAARRPGTSRATTDCVAWLRATLRSKPGNAGDRACPTPRTSLSNTALGWPTSCVFRV
jgi:ATPase subunit of ABC transporter with duplicated ATPase domains